MFPFDLERSFYHPKHDHGLWSPSTSSANFCEEDYIITFYVAEFLNTLSNLAYVYYALRPPQIRSGFGFQGAITNGTSRSRKSKSRWPILDLQAMALISVGLTSGLFHATLHSLPQWLDESSMYLLAGSWIYILLTTQYFKIPQKPTTTVHSNGRAIDHTAATTARPKLRVVRGNQWKVSAALALILAQASLFSHFTGNLDIHSIMFGILLVVSAIRLWSFIALATSTDSPGAESTLRMQEYRKVLLGTLRRAVFFLALGFGLWLIDCDPSACQMLRHVRREWFGKVPLLWPLGAVTELHAWWHIFTARAAGEYISLVRHLTMER